MMNGVLMVLGVSMMVGALVAQLVKNAEVGAEIDQTSSPYFLILYPLAIIFKLRGEYDLIVEACSVHKNVLVAVSQGAGLIVMVVGYSIWIFQYAYHLDEEAAQVGYYIAATLILVLGAVATFYTYKAIGGPRRHRQKVSAAHLENDEAAGTELRVYHTNANRDTSVSEVDDDDDDGIDDAVDALLTTTPPRPVISAGFL